MRRTIAICALSVAMMFGQSPRFDVASIKLSKDPAPGGDTQITPGRFHGKDLALRMFYRPQRPPEWRAVRSSG